MESLLAKFHIHKLTGHLLIFLMFLLQSSHLFTYSEMACGNLIAEDVNVPH